MNTDHQINGSPDSLIGSSPLGRKLLSDEDLYGNCDSNDGSLKDGDAPLIETARNKLNDSCSSSDSSPKSSKSRSSSQSI